MDKRRKGKGRKKKKNQGAQAAAAKGNTVEKQEKTPKQPEPPEKATMPVKRSGWGKCCVISGAILAVFIGNTKSCFSRFPSQAQSVCEHIATLLKCYV